MFYVNVKVFQHQGDSLSRYLEHSLNIENLGFKLKMAHSLHQQTIQALEIEMFKIHHGFSKFSSLDL